MAADTRERLQKENWRLSTGPAGRDLPKPGSSAIWQPSGGSSEPNERPRKIFVQEREALQAKPRRSARNSLFGDIGRLFGPFSLAGRWLPNRMGSSAGRPRRRADGAPGELPFAGTAVRGKRLRPDLVRGNGHARGGRSIRISSFSPDTLAVSSGWSKDAPSRARAEGSRRDAVSGPHSPIDATGRFPSRRNSGAIIASTKPRSRSLHRHPRGHPLISDEGS